MIQVSQVPNLRNLNSVNTFGAIPIVFCGNVSILGRIFSRHSDDY